jgi:hypothetical protein
MQNERQICAFDDYDGVVSTSDPVFSGGRNATVLVRQDFVLTIPRGDLSDVRTTYHITMWIYDLELRGGQWTVVRTRIEGQS